MVALLVLFGVIEVSNNGEDIGPKPFGLVSLLYLLGCGSLAALTLLG